MRSIEIGSSRGSRSLSIHRSIKSFISLLSFFIRILPLFPFYIYSSSSFFFSLKSFSSFPFLLFLPRNFGQSRSQTESTDRRIRIGLVPARKRLLAAGNSKWCRRNERKIYNSKLQLKNNLFETNVNVFKGEKRKKNAKELWYLFSFHRHLRLQRCNAKINYGKPEKKSIDLSSVGRTRTGVGNPLSVQRSFTNTCAKKKEKKNRSVVCFVNIAHR